MVLHNLQVELTSLLQPTSARQWHKTSHRADSSGPHPRTPRNATISLVLRHSRPRNRHWGSFPRAPKTSSSEKDMARARWTDFTKRETNLRREPLASAKYTEKGQSLRKVETGRKTRIHESELPVIPERDFPRLPKGKNPNYALRDSRKRIALHSRKGILDTLPRGRCTTHGREIPPHP